MNNSPIAVVTSTIPITLDKFHRELIRQLGTAGYHVHVVSSSGPALDRLIEDLPVTAHRLEMARDIAPAHDAASLRQWFRLLRTLKPELVVSATPKASLLAQLAARALRVRQRLYYVGGLRLEGASGRKKTVLTAMERLTAACATAIVTNSASLRQAYVTHGLAPAAKVRQTTPGSSHGVDSEHFAPRSAEPALAQSLGLDLERPIIGFIGRLTHDKGIDTLIEAGQILAAQRSDIQLLVIGSQDEPDSQIYLDRLVTAGLHTVVIDSVEDVRPYLALLTIHVLPSLREGFPNVVLEASAMGVVTVTTDATGCIDSVRHGITGLIVPVGDRTRLSAAIADLLADPDRRGRMAAEARNWVVAEFTPTSVVRSLLESVTEESRVPD